MNYLYKEIEPLKVMENIGDCSVGFVYLDAPYFSGGELDLRGNRSIREIIAKRDNIDFGKVTIKSIEEYRKELEQKEIDKYTLLLSKLIENAKRIVKDDGYVCVYAPNHQYTNINYSLLLEQFFQTSRKITLERRMMPGARMNKIENNDSLFILSKNKDGIIPVAKELPPVEDFPQIDEVDHYRLMPATLHANRERNNYEYAGILPSKGTCWRYSIERMKELDALNRLVISNDRISIKQYRNESLREVSDVWKNENDRMFISNVSVGTEIYRRLLSTYNRENGVVFCPYDRDGKFAYISEEMKIQWISTYTPIQTERPDFLSLIKKDSYEEISNLLEIGEVNYTENVVTRIEDVQRIKEENAALKEKISNLTESIHKIQASISMNETDELCIDDIIEQIHKETTSVLESVDYERYLPEAQEWVNPHWQLLEEDSKRFIPTGIMIGDILEKIGDNDAIDKAPVIIEYCKTLEKELFQKIFYGYIKDLIQRDVNVKKQFSNSFGKDKDNKIKRTDLFANFLHECTTEYRDKPNQWRFEIGKMTRVLTMTLRNDIPDDELVNDFMGYLQKMFDGQFFSESFEKKLNDIAELRNKCAHPNIVDGKKAEKGKNAIRDKLLSILSYYTGR